jgi:cadmium resistance protein CadD (predicted permease)
MFAVTNVDDVMLLALYFGRAGRDRAAARRVVLGQYAGFLAILALSLAGALGFGQLEGSVTAYLGLVPLALGLRAARELVVEDHAVGALPAPGSAQAITVWGVASVTFANGGDNVGVYVPVLATASTRTATVYVVVLLLGVAAACLVGRALAASPLVARAAARWGHVLLPLVLVTIGVAILVEGGAFGLQRA